MDGAQDDYSGGYEEKTAAQRETSEMYPTQHPHQQYLAPLQHQPPLNSPQPSSASPFAFAPPPLSHASSHSTIQTTGHTRPPPPVPIPHAQSDPAAPGYASHPYYAKPQHHHQPHLQSFNSYTSTPMSYRSYSNDSPKAHSHSVNHSPSNQPLQRTPSLGLNTSSLSLAQHSPSPGPPSYFQRQVSNGNMNYQTSSSPQRQAYAHAHSYSPYAYPQPSPSSTDMPRSLTYPQQQQQHPYPGPAGGMMSNPSLAAHPHLHQPPSLNRGNSTPGLEPSLGYSFANRLPLVDRPFKCDECVQSFNRNHDLKRHKRIHLSVKPFACDKCGKTFSRKDALRRHWLVKGCRGEDGATAPITPMFPLNSVPPGLSPPSPPRGNPSPHPYHPASYSHPLAPPPLHTLPHRHTSDNSQVIITPDDMSALPSANSHSSGSGTNHHSGPSSAPLDEPIVLDNPTGSNRSSESSHEGYFEGVVGIKNDGTALLEKNQTSSPFTSQPRYATYPPNQQGGPSYQQQDYREQHQQRMYEPSQLHSDGRPVFATPFARGDYSGHHQGGMLAPPMSEGHEMEKTGSHDGDSQSWQRWKRPSFPFPPPPGSSYYDTPSSTMAGGEGYNQ